MFQEKPGNGPAASLSGAFLESQHAIIPPSPADRRFRTITPRTIKRERRATQKKTRVKRARKENSCNKNNSSKSNISNDSSALLSASPSSPSGHVDRVPKEEDEAWEIHIDDIPEDQVEAWAFSDVAWNQAHSDVSDCSSVLDLCTNHLDDNDVFYDAHDRLHPSPANSTTDTSEDYLSPMED